MDKAALVQAWGGPAIGDVATHIAPNTLLNDQLADYDPYATDGNHGSVEKAKAGDEGLEVRHEAATARAAPRRARTCC